MMIAVGTDSVWGAAASILNVPPFVAWNPPGAEVWPSDMMKIRLGYNKESGVHLDRCKVPLMFPIRKEWPRAESAS